MSIRRIDRRLVPFGMSPWPGGVGFPSLGVGILSVGDVVLVIVEELGTGVVGVLLADALLPDVLHEVAVHHAVRAGLEEVELAGFHLLRLIDIDVARAVAVLTGATGRQAEVEEVLRVALVGRAVRDKRRRCLGIGQKGRNRTQLDNRRHTLFALRQDEVQRIDRIPLGIPTGRDERAGRLHARRGGYLGKDGNLGNLALLLVREVGEGEAKVGDSNQRAVGGVRLRLQFPLDARVPLAQDDRLAGVALVTLQEGNIHQGKPLGRADISPLDSRLRGGKLNIPTVHPLQHGHGDAHQLHARPALLDAGEGRNAGEGADFFKFGQFLGFGGKLLLDFRRNLLNLGSRDDGAAG